MIFAGKTIIFGAPYDFLNKKIMINLQALGFNVIDICFEQKYKYKSLKDRLLNLFQKLFLGDSSYKKKLRFATVEIQMNQKLDSLTNKADYVLLIRPDIYPEYFLKKLKNYTHLMVGYQWDGIRRFPEVKRIVKYFERFFVFDPTDVKENYLPTTNFYFDDEVIDFQTNQKQVFFVGVFSRNRVRPIKKLVQEIEKTDFKIDISLRTVKKHIVKQYKNATVKVSNEFLSLEENHRRVKESAILVDILNNVHKGLSFRTFEALKYRKKLITTNANIKQYDFYNPNNILVLETDADYKRIVPFLSIKYVELPTEIYEKYSFTNWIKYMLNIQPYQSINLPRTN